MLVAVQVVHQVAIAAVFRDDVDGPCGGTGSATVPGRPQTPHGGPEADDRLHIGKAFG